MKLLGVISAGFDVRDQLLMRFFAFVQFWRKNGSTMRQYISFKKAYDLMRREVLYNIIMVFGVPIKLVRLIKMSLKETYSKFHIGKHLSDTFLFFTFALEYDIRKVQENQVD
jgi:hypothetical protein